MGLVFVLFDKVFDVMKRFVVGKIFEIEFVERIEQELNLEQRPIIQQLHQYQSKYLIINIQRKRRRTEDKLVQK
jgi:hypothetical protein